MSIINFTGLKNLFDNPSFKSNLFFEDLDLGKISLYAYISKAELFDGSFPLEVGPITIKFDEMMPVYNRCAKELCLTSNPITSDFLETDDPYYSDDKIEVGQVWRTNGQLQSKDDLFISNESVFKYISTNEEKVISQNMIAVSYNWSIVDFGGVRGKRKLSPAQGKILRHLYFSKKTLSVTQITELLTNEEFESAKKKYGKLDVSNTFKGPFRELITFEGKRSGLYSFNSKLIVKEEN